MAKLFTFLVFCWLGVTIAGNIMVGGISGAVVSTQLVSAITDASSTISVSNANGLEGSGIVQIGDERIAYSQRTSTQLSGSLTQPLVRGAGGTTAAAHAAGSRVRTVEGSMLNASAEYNVALIADSSGLWGAITIGLALMRLLGNFMFLPLSFLGTDLQIISYIYICVSLGALVTFGLALAGTRRV